MKYRTFLAQSLRVFWLCSMLMAGNAAVQAAEITGMYEATVTVPTRDSERARNQGFAEAMREMLVRLTGRTDTLSHPAIARALASPQSYVDFWAYRSRPAQEPGQPDQIALQITFFESSVQSLLGDAGIPVWPLNRPDTLLWVVVQNEFGDRVIAGTLEGSERALLDEVHEAARRRGLPLLNPLLDFTDQRALRPDQLWSLDEEAIRSASLRYGTDSILVLRVFRTAGEQVVGKALYLFRDRQLEHEVFDSPLAPLLEAGVDLAAHELAGYYAVMLSGVDNSTEVLLTVDGVRSVDDYAGLLEYLHSIAVVNDLQVYSVDGETATLQLKTGGQFRQLIESIALDRRLQAVSEFSRQAQQVSLHYRWLAR